MDRNDVKTKMEAAVRAGDNKKTAALAAVLVALAVDALLEAKTNG